MEIAYVGPTYWTNVGPTSKLTLAKGKTPTFAQRSSQPYAKVVQTLACYLDTDTLQYNCEELCENQFSDCCIHLTTSKFQAMASPLTQDYRNEIYRGLDPKQDVNIFCFNQVYM